MQNLSKKRFSSPPGQAADRATVFDHPEPAPRRVRVWPVFLPHAGCPGRCVYCAQRLQTGTGAARPEAVLLELDAALGAALAQGRGPYEIGFYGGTFTALPQDLAGRFVALADVYRKRGLVSRVRCSTRPDAVSPARLAALRELGLDMVELGVQTFDSGVLAASGRGYGPDTAVTACRAVREAGLSLGIQLLPGLPDHTPEMFARDVVQTAALEPETARLYPCLVLSGTRLAELFAAGEYAPWSEETALEAVATALPVLWRAGVRVARMGVAPQPGLSEAMVAGPACPALGNRARARALAALVRENARGLGPGPKGLCVPARYSGEIWGQGRELEPCYAALGILRENVAVDRQAKTFRLRLLASEDGEAVGGGHFVRPVDRRASRT